MSMIRNTRLIYLAGVTVLFFLIANVTGGSHAHPGTTSNIFWVATIVCLVALLLLALWALVQRIVARSRS
jgi:uncharacterized membrane protein YhaH (DUF805 family)